MSRTLKLLTKINVFKYLCNTRRISYHLSLGFGRCNTPAVFTDCFTIRTRSILYNKNTEFALFCRQNRATVTVKLLHLLKAKNSRKEYLTCMTKVFQIVVLINNLSDLQKEKITQDFSKFTVNCEPDYNDLLVAK